MEFIDDGRFADPGVSGDENNSGLPPATMRSKAESRVSISRSRPYNSRGSAAVWNIVFPRRKIIDSLASPAQRGSAEGRSRPLLQSGSCPRQSWRSNFIDDR